MSLLWPAQKCCPKVHFELLIGKKFLVFSVAKILSHIETLQATLLDSVGLIERKWLQRSCR
jgi:hypothetical protein